MISCSLKNHQWRSILLLFGVASSVLAWIPPSAMGRSSQNSAHASAVSFSSPTQRQRRQLSASSDPSTSTSLDNDDGDNITDDSTSTTTSRTANTHLPSQSPPNRLDGCVALVTGASRGIGRGIALELGQRGCIVYVTGTTTVGTPDSPGTVQETADAINRHHSNSSNNGSSNSSISRGIAVLCDHSNDDDVRALMQQISDEQNGKLHILVNNAFQLPKSGIETLQQKFWEQGPDAWDPIHTVGLRSHYVTSCFAMPLMLAAAEEEVRPLPRPIVGMVSSFGGLTYTFNVAYGVGKAGVDRLAKDMAIELLEKDICVVSLWPGIVDTERTQRSVETGDWDKFIGIPLDNSETPNFTGRAMVALASDKENMAKTGTYQVVAEVADEYGFDDVNGRHPLSIRSLRFLLPTYGFDDETRNRIPASWIPDWKLPFWVMAQGKPPETK